MEKVCFISGLSHWSSSELSVGSATFCLLSQHMTVVLQRLEVPIPRKLATNSSAHEKVRSNCFESVGAYTQSWL